MICTGTFLVACKLVQELLLLLLCLLLLNLLLLLQRDRRRRWPSVNSCKKQEGSEMLVSHGVIHAASSDLGRC